MAVHDRVPKEKERKTRVSDPASEMYPESIVLDCF
jgi:hypothetical protein